MKYTVVQLASIIVEQSVLTLWIKRKDDVYNNLKTSRQLIIYMLAAVNILLQIVYGLC